MPRRDIVAIGASAGGIDALQRLLGKLSPSFDAAVLVTLHLAVDYASALDRILSRSGALPVRFAESGEKIENGQVYLARSHGHLLLNADWRIELGRGPRENNARPAIDPMFRSVALCCGARAIGVVLSGMLDDGAAGLLALKQCGGATVVQEPSDAAFPDMPMHALHRARPDHVATLAAMPALLKKLVQQPAGERLPAPESLRFEVEIARSGRSNMSEMDRIGRRSVLACPDCHGVMWEIDEGELVRYRCHVGHAYTAESMRYAIDENLARALASALRALDERVAIAEKLRDRAIESQHTSSVALWQSRIDETRREADTIRESILRMEQVPSEDTGA
jgi:two-component system, chemotaxis family, protein-glutamate methylesterase/glutaminase